jgi:hypothetical protein
VTRGVCLTDESRHLTGLSERRKVTRQPDGSFIADDGLEPKELSGDALVSMNLWGFQPGIWRILEEAVLEAHPEVAPDGTLRDPGLGDSGLGDSGLGDSGKSVTNAEETLLPEVVGRAVSAGTLDVTIEAAPGRSVGVTHAADLPIARAEIAQMVGRGERSEELWKGAH